MSGKRLGLIGIESVVPPNELEAIEVARLK
jgi:hypothetical protein